MTMQGPNILFYQLEMKKKKKIAIPYEAHIWKTNSLIESILW